MKWYVSTRARVMLALLGAETAGVLLFLMGGLHNHAWDFAYLLYNLALAWIPLGFSLWLERILRRKLWSSWQALGLTALWLVFLPNSFYMVTDFVHLPDVQRVNPVTDVVMFSSFILNAFIVGLISLYLVHQQLVARVARRTAWTLMLVVVGLCSFAISIGRYLRWNTWDVLLNPASILFDVSDYLLHPRSHPEALYTTLSFFLLIGSVYAVAWQLARALRSNGQRAA